MVQILFRYRGSDKVMNMNKLAKTVVSFTLGISLLISAVSEASAATYTVKSGDTLSSIAKKYGTTYTHIMNLNGLDSTRIAIGQQINVSDIATNSSSTTIKSKAVSVAKQYLGVPYVFGGSTPSGFDCSGLIYYTFKKAGKSISRTSAAGYYKMATKVKSPQVGDLVFFSNTYKAGVSHVGIYLGNNKMISAHGTTVNITTIQSSYWKSHFTGYGRI